MNAPEARWLIADETAHRHVDDHRTPSDSGIGEMPLIAAVDTMRSHAAAGAVHGAVVRSTRGDVACATLHEHTLDQPRLQVWKHDVACPAAMPAALSCTDTARTATTITMRNTSTVRLCLSPVFFCRITPADSAGTPAAPYSGCRAPRLGSAFRRALSRTCRRSRFVLGAGWPSGAGASGIGNTGRAGEVSADVPEPPADPGPAAIRTTRPSPSR